jgi:ATP-dependent helicase/nuclease subunit B
LLVPTRQRARAVQLAYAAERLAGGERVWPSADVLPYAAWAHREAERRAALDPKLWPRILSASEEWYLWRECAAEAAGELALLDTGALAEGLARASELAAQYAIAPAGAAAAGEAGLYARAQRGFAGRVAALNATSGTALAHRLQAPSGADAPLACGFDSATPLLRALARVRGPGEAACAPRQVRPADLDEELYAIAGWCRQRLAGQPDPRLLVIVPGHEGMRERLAALIRQALVPESVAEPRAGAAAVALEGGPALSAAPLPKHALATLNFLAGRELDFEALARWLLAPFWAQPDSLARAKLAHYLRQRALARLDLRELSGALQLVPRALQGPARELDATLRRAAAALADGATSPRGWAERAREALAHLKWPGAGERESAHWQTLMRWHELLEDFGQLSGSLPLLPRARALELLEALAGRTAYRPADEDVAVTVSAALADPVVRYDGMWVAGLSAEAFPQAVTPEPFLPLQAQLAAGVPQATSAGRRAQAEWLLATWRAGASELVLSLARHGRDLELAPSPLLAQVPLVPPGASERWLPARLHRAGLTDSLADERGTPWRAAEPLPGTRTLVLQNQCPFRAYAELRLGALAPESADLGIAADQRGLLLHAALEWLWGELKGQAALLELSPPALAGLIARAVAQARQTLAARVPQRRRTRRVADTQLELFAALPAALARECRRAERLIATLLDLERARAPFRVVATEFASELSLGGARMRLRLDRIDALEDGRRVILDYKSGRRAGADWYGERPSHPQLLGYLAALGEGVSALANVHVNAREVAFAGIAESDGILPRVKSVRARPEVPDWAAQQERWRATVARLIEEFLAGDARVDPVPGACSFCHVIDLCRIREPFAPDAAPLPGGADD